MNRKKMFILLNKLKSKAHFLAIIILVNILEAQTDSCLTEINGALKGQSGNVQDNMFHSLAIDPYNENVVYVGTETNGIFKTIDGGKTWARLRKGLKCTIYQTGYSQIFDVVIDPKNPQIVYAATVNGPGPTGNMAYPSNSGGVYKSIDGGKTWQQKVKGFTNTYTIYILIDSTNTNRIYAGIGGVLSKFSMTNNIFYEGGILVSNDAGESWAPLNLPTGVNTNIFIDMVIRGNQQKIIYASGQLHKNDAPVAYGLIKSVDGGATWNFANPTGTLIYGFDVYKKNPNIIYGHDTSSQRKVYKSTDGGTTWASVPNSSFFGTIKIHPRDSSIIFTTTFHGIKKSTNGLNSSQTILEDTSLSSSQQILDIEISESNNNIVWSCAKGYYLYKSTDGGNTFLKITAVRDSVYQSVVSVKDKIPNPSMQFYLEQNYPNPFNPSTTIHYSIPFRENVSLKVFDVLGREVATLVNSEINAGEHFVKFEGTNLQSGIYFIQIKTAKFVQMRRAILIK